jgi:hypothetical protein
MRPERRHVAFAKPEVIGTDEDRGMPDVVYRVQLTNDRGRIAAKYTHTGTLPGSGACGMQQCTLYCSVQSWNSRCDGW